MPPTLFIDLDGTIMRNPFWPVIFPAIGAHLAGKTGLNSAAIIDMIVAENRRRISEHGDATLAMDWDDIVQTVAARLGVTCELSAEQLNNDHASPPDTAILDDADQVLQAIKEMGWQIVAATHGLSRYQVPVLRALGLLSLFTDVAAPACTLRRLIRRRCPFRDQLRYPQRLEDNARRRRRAPCRQRHPPRRRDLPPA